MSNVEVKVKEKDKPFILALIASAFIGISLVAWFFKPEIGEKMFAAVSTFTGMSWGYYFATKK